MPRPKYKSYYTIEIKKESIETVPGEGSELDKKETVNKTIYTQTVEKINLKAVIEAVNAETKK